MNGTTSHCHWGIVTTIATNEVHDLEDLLLKPLKYHGPNDSEKFSQQTASSASTRPDCADRCARLDIQSVVPLPHCRLPRQRLEYTATMAPTLEIAIPSTQLSSDGKYTIYNISLKLPLRSYSIQKRYSDFLVLHQSLTEQIGRAPPSTPPPKSWFTRTVSSPELTETRRKGLEQYLQTINSTSDSRWRETPIWRAFLNLPSSYTSKNTTSSTATLHSILTGPGGPNATPITDPTIWLEVHRDLKSQLHDARLDLTTRDQASNPSAQHEASASAKSHLVKAGTLLSALETSLTELSKTTPSDPSQRLGPGEIRRRKDLLALARKDRDALENLHAAMATKAKLDSAVASIQEHTSLLSPSPSHSQSHSPSRATANSKPRSTRILGRETAETTPLSNTSLLQLQTQKMADQDLDVEEIRKIVIRQKELGLAISQELEVQNDLLKLVDEDVDRVKGKIDVAKRRIGKIK